MDWNGLNNNQVNRTRVVFREQWRVPYQDCVPGARGCPDCRQSSQWSGASHRWPSCVASVARRTSSCGRHGTTALRPIDPARRAPPLSCPCSTSPWWAGRCALWRRRRRTASAPSSRGALRTPRWCASLSILPDPDAVWLKRTRHLSATLSNTTRKRSNQLINSSVLIDDVTAGWAHNQTDDTNSTGFINSDFNLTGWTKKNWLQPVSVRVGHGLITGWNGFTSRIGFNQFRRV